MAFTPKTWLDSPSTLTPLTAAALIDVETRLSAYSDTAATAIRSLTAPGAGVWDTGVGLAVAVGAAHGIRLGMASTVTRCELRTDVAPTGSSLIVQFVQTTGVMATLTIPAASTTTQVTTTIANATVAIGNYVWTNVTSVGSTSAAVGVTAQLDYVSV